MSNVHAILRMLGREPTIIASAPGRINLMGDHTDYNDGFVFPMALNMTTTLSASPNGAAASHFLSVEMGEFHTCSLRHGKAEGFSRYIIAVARELIELGWDVPELDVRIDSRVPIGAGLASSGALVVAAATMFEALAGRSLSPLEKAKLCQRAEHACGTPCGIMDMFVATHAQPGCAMLLDCRSLKFEHVPFRAANEMVLFIVNTGVQHELADGAYADRREACASAARKLGKAALRDVSEAELDAGAAVLSPVEFRRTRHVIRENTRTLQAAEALRTGDLKSLGTLMFESHASLAEDYEVSCPELDAVVELVREHAPQLGFGARMTGAGFGGCAIVACAAERAGYVREIIGRLLNRRFGLRFEMFRALPGGAAGCQVGRYAPGP